MATLKYYKLHGNTFEIRDLDKKLTTYVENETAAFAYSIVSDEGKLLQFGRYPELLDMLGILDDIDVQLLDEAFGEKE